MDAVILDNLAKTFKGKRGDVVKAVRNLSLGIGQGEIFGFLGPNGAGKSTTIKMLTGLIRPTSGRASVMGRDVGSHLSRKSIGYLPENPSFYDYLTSEEYLNFVGRVFGMSGKMLSEKSEEVLRLLQLWDARKRPVRSYSKGMVQRLGLAQILIHDPEVYILDEPMSGLDPLGRALVKDILISLRKRGKCVFFSTHITGDVETVCDRVGVILKGELQCVERVETILTEGILGYEVRVRTAPGSEDEKELYVSKEDLPDRIAELHASKREITLIEPRRKSIETFFLDIVKGGKC
jgi:ABC-2 type transport system ATP-binding protein